MSNAVSLAERFNRECECSVVDVPALRARFDPALGTETHAHLFADTPVFLAADHAREMQRVIAAVESVTHLPAYREAVLSNAPEIARRPPHTRGVFLGFDFHIAPDGPKLIEINTNAGGALLNLELQRSQQTCCTALTDRLCGVSAPGSVEDEIFGMFLTEWRLARGTQPLHTIAIVDDAPGEQYLYPEFLRFQALFESRGVHAFIADARALTIDSGSLMHHGRRIDLVYNRCTDFYFSDTAHSALARAHAQDLAVVTPHPHAHALYSHKANLVLLSDEPTLRAMHAAPEDIDVLTDAIPQTRRVGAAEAHWWDQRKHWFFKPESGFGSRGTYRGDKITRRAFGDVMGGGYIAQRFAPPSERRRPAAAECFKVDVRNYVYDGKTQLLAARLYQGQTTNFRTAGGGFAPVFLLDDAAAAPR